MLQIFLYGPRESGFLELSPGTSLDMESLSELFDEQLTIGEYSIPMEFPWTEYNLRLTGFAHRPQNGKQPTPYFECDVYDSGFPEIQKGKFTILGSKGSFTPGKGTFNATISGTKGVFGSAIRNKKLKDLALGGTIVFTEDSSRQFATSVMKGLYPQYTYIAFAPVARLDYFDTDRADYSGEFLVRDRVNNLMLTGAPPDGWVLGRPDPDNATTEITQGNALFKDYRTVPFFQLKHVLKACFEEFGFKLSGTFFNTTAFDDVYLDNNYSIEEYAVNYDINRRIIPSNHMPDITVRDFIISVCAWLNMYLRFSGGNQIELRYRTATLQGTRVFDCTEYVENLFELTRSTEDTEQPLNFAYQTDSLDSQQSDSIKNLTGKTVVATVNSAAELATLDIGRPLTTNDLALVMNEGIYYQVADATGSPIVWDAYATALQPIVIDDKANTLDIPLCPLVQYITFSEGAGKYLNEGCLAIRQKGSYINNKGIRVNNPFGLRTLYISKKPWAAYEVPASYYHHLDENSVQIQPYSLMLDGEFGIVKNFHQQWANAKRNSGTIKTTLQAPSSVLAEIRKADRLIVADVQYLLLRLERPIPFANRASIELLPL